MHENEQTLACPPRSNKKAESELVDYTVARLMMTADLFISVRIRLSSCRRHSSNYTRAGTKEEQATCSPAIELRTRTDTMTVKHQLNSSGANLTMFADNDGYK